MKLADLTHDQSIEENLITWCFEVGSRFELSNKEAVDHFAAIIESLRLEKKVVELGCGDGAALKYFVEHGFSTLGVDINQTKLANIVATTICVDVLEWLKSVDKILGHVFTHHSLEHMVSVKEVIEEIGEKLSPGNIYYAIVPAGDYLHSVHHVVFDDPSELLPSQLVPLILAEQVRQEPEFICVGIKPL